MSQPEENMVYEKRPNEPQPQSGDATSTERVRQHRRRRREGLRLAHLEIRSSEITFLVGQGWLQPGQEDDPYALARAVGRLLDLLMPELDARRIVIKRKQ